ncbi:TonB-dependent receptor [Sphingobacterium sp. SGG-5]|uniref:TonB-dependent receptor n=1 Tax=Sphingobacterium sp. SGG-5 TaxID=2710881 RepID=UPI0013EBB284|nr:TonB-dependent receptor [Sphingobacterium sp. SGG-5]NGM62023.1 TonB-dependent receptor [Sphingobacterium sp. SGG-5]
MKKFGIFLYFFLLSFLSFGQEDIEGYIGRYIDSVEVIGNSDTRHTLSSHLLSKERRAASYGKNLAEVLTDIAGVNILRTGSNIAKPVLNGLYGSRLLIVNNGVRHESQQWGLDHAPEIDPFSAQSITVIKNADAVRYGPDALAGVIVLVPDTADSDRIFSGRINSIFQSNGKAYTLHTGAKGTYKGFSYHVDISGTKSGNAKTADYYLGNTGVNELNYSMRLRYRHHAHTFAISHSRFATELGVFIGAHIGSKTDILARIAHGRPYDDYAFSYLIDAPKQKVLHETSILNWQYQLSDRQKVEATYSLQRNHRKEFDLRRVQSDDTPMADMVLTTQNMEILYQIAQTKLGISGTLQVNNNVPGTGTTPIIPNFDNHTFGAFATHKLSWHNNVTELGLRYDYKYFDVAGYRYNYREPNSDGSLNQYLLQDQKHFNNLSGMIGNTLKITKNWYWKSNIGLAWRAPSANELYSDGIHHGTGTYEVGNPNMKSEKGIKWVNTIHFARERIEANADLFAQRIFDYIYAQPHPDSVRQTIRGTFPLFQYVQQDALLYGYDIHISANLANRWVYTAGVSSVIGINSTEDTYLPFIPSDRINQGIAYRWGEGTYIKLDHAYVARQKHYEDGSDYAAPPPAYQLWGATASYSFAVHDRQQLHILVDADNLFNAAYKDYMDRFRYYAHARGRNISIKLNYTF